MKNNININFKKNNGLVPAIIQDVTTLQVLMLGYMNEEALQKTMNDGKVCFYSRSKQRLWVKGESSGNFLWVKSLQHDCDNDTILIKARSEGPTCHTGNTSCFFQEEYPQFIYRLEQIIQQRIDDNADDSYTNRLFKKGINKVAQKVGEEAVELIIEAKDHDDHLFKNEAADLLYHFLILLKAKGLKLLDIEAVLKERHNSR
ncbi:MAG: bifunctional phosphoribosyl-AMP cyclohydrolase/phosphoribosyl-ATP diphosphatase [Bacteroidetes bacterium HGW-Bacteroidetes-17]|jgi:phosphoribosyl-ATP pyrophosphohydrolase/phosphoribosyl-AMP cyclohydrolase|nr:MAG: bifunctional phosphoribosyl-AMP cyclohydrolase/phosphoribosyl-ATP diphosphatase [Bacteroidetes bacterium HGW-Bacteroidetes-17]